MYFTEKRHFFLTNNTNTRKIKMTKILEQKINCTSPTIFLYTYYSKWCSVSLLSSFRLKCCFYDKDGGSNGGDQTQRDQCTQHCRWSWYMVSMGQTYDTAPVWVHLQYLNGSQLLRHLRVFSTGFWQPGRPFPCV